jgi:predicted permease
MSLKKLLNPVLISIAIGAVLGLTGIGRKLPGVVTEVVNKSAACMSPISMILAGMVLAEFKFATLLKRGSNYVVTALRLVVLPLAIAGVLKLLGLGLNEVIIPSLMIYAMPCGMNTIVFPRLVGEDCEPGAALALISTVACCVTLPLCVLLFA